MLRNFLGDRSGNFAVITALAALPVIGVSGMAVDLSMAYRHRTAMQNSADAAALASVKLFAKPGQTTGPSDQSQYREEGTLLFAANLPNDAVALDIAFDTAARTATVAADYVYPLAFKIYASELPLRVVSVATVGQPESTYCMIALSRTASKAISIEASAEFIAPRCSVHSNSVSSSALNQQGSGKANAKDFCAVGGSMGRFAPDPTAGCEPIADPLADIPLPPLNGTCDHVSQVFGAGTHYLTPGRYCGAVKIPSHANLQLAPGVYIFSKGSIEMSGQSSLVGQDGVTLIFADELSRLNMTGGANLKITAPKTGTYAGIAIAGQRNISPKGPVKLTGGGEVEIEGTVYMPSHDLVVTGSGSLGVGTAQTALIANTITMTGNSTTALSINANADFEAAGYGEMQQKLATYLGPILVR